MTLIQTCGDHGMTKGRQRWNTLKFFSPSRLHSKIPKISYFWFKFVIWIWCNANHLSTVHVSLEATVLPSKAQKIRSSHTHTRLHCATSFEGSMNVNKKRKSECTVNIILANLAVINKLVRIYVCAFVHVRAFDIASDSNLFIVSFLFNTQFFI